MNNCKQHLPEHQGNHVALVALDLVADGPEIGTPSLFVNVARSLFPKRRKRKPGFTQAAVTRAVEGVKSTGAEIGKVEVTRDKITVEIGGKADDDGARDASLVAMDRIAALRRVK